MKNAIVVAGASLVAGCMGGFVPVAPQPTGFEQGNPCNLVAPIQHPPADYPSGAGEQPGWVALQYDIGADGATSNVMVKASSPEDEFDRSAVAAVSQWKYRPDQAIAGCRLLITFRPPES
jgi:TonB family protein